MTEHPVLMGQPVSTRRGVPPVRGASRVERVSFLPWAKRRRGLESTLVGGA